MHKLSVFWRVLFIFALVFRIAPASFADVPYQTGVTTFRGATTNLVGTGVRVCLAEAPSSGENIMVNPADVGCPTNLFTYFTSAGISSNYPNSFGTNDYHCDRVAAYLCGTVTSSPIFGGCPLGIAPGLAHVDDMDANYFINNYLLTSSRVNDAIVNQSFDFVVTNGAGETPLDTDYDNYAANYGTLFVGSIGAGGHVVPPGTAYNSIGVAAYQLGGANSSVGPTMDNYRCKPDITGPDPNTSFVVPQVAGCAAVLMQAGLRGDGGGNTNAAVDIRTIKALLLNGAVKLLGWTNGPTSPLDARYGAGMLNLHNAYVQLAGGRQTNFVTTSTATVGGVHPPNANATNFIASLSGWDFTTNTSAGTYDSVHHYYFTVTNNSAKTFFLTSATLTWHRHAGALSINNLRLYLYNAANSNLVNCSTSAVDNVQHIYNAHLAPGRYDLQVLKAGGSYVTAAEPYALAYAFAPLPVLKVAHTTNSTTVTWPAYPAGFQLQAITNLFATNTWSTNNVPYPTVTNQQNIVVLNPTNKAQFFELYSPNF